MLMKNCIDRFAYTCHRPKYFNQKFMLLVTSGSYMGVKNALKALSILVSGGKIIRRLSVYNSPDMNESKRKIQEDKIKKSTEEFAKVLSKTNGSKPPFSYLIWFSVFKASSVKSQKGLPADFHHYKDKEYFVDCDLNSFQKTSIKILTSFFSFMITKGFV